MLVDPRPGMFCWFSKVLQEIMAENPSTDGPILWRIVRYHGCIRMNTEEMGGVKHRRVDAVTHTLGTPELLKANRCFVTHLEFSKDGNKKKFANDRFLKPLESVICFSCQLLLLSNLRGLLKDDDLLHNPLLRF